MVGRVAEEHPAAELPHRGDAGSVLGHRQHQAGLVDPDAEAGVPQHRRDVGVAAEHPVAEWAAQHRGMLTEAPVLGIGVRVGFRIERVEEDGFFGGKLPAAVCAHEP